MQSAPLQTPTYPHTALATALVIQLSEDMEDFEATWLPIERLDMLQKQLKVRQISFSFAGVGTRINWFCQIYCSKLF
jgi:hypothetical protein